MNSHPEVSMTLPAIEEPIHWQRYVNMPTQDADTLSAQAEKLSGQIIDPNLFADAIAADHDAIIYRTADALGMEIVSFMAAVHSQRIVWQSPLLGKWVLAKSTEKDWTPVPGVYTCPLAFRQSRPPASKP